MVRAMSGAQLKGREKTEYIISMLGLIGTIDQLVIANNVHWYGHVMRRDDGHVMRRDDGHVMRRDDGHVMRRDDGHVMSMEDSHVLRFILLEFDCKRKTGRMKRTCKNRMRKKA